MCLYGLLASDETTSYFLEVVYSFPYKPGQLVSIIRDEVMLGEQ
jgi:hypothetical protein